MISYYSKLKALEDIRQWKQKVQITIKTLISLSLPSPMQLFFYSLCTLGLLNSAFKLFLPVSSIACNSMYFRITPFCCLSVNALQYIRPSWYMNLKLLKQGQILFTLQCTKSQIMLHRNEENVHWAHTQSVTSSLRMNNRFSPFFT